LVTKDLVEIGDEVLEFSGLVGIEPHIVVSPFGSVSCFHIGHNDCDSGVIRHTFILREVEADFTHPGIKFSFISIQVGGLANLQVRQAGGGWNNWSGREIRL
jgi:hypothetical protein